MADKSDVYARTIKWKERLEAVDGVRPIVWSTITFVEINESGIKSIERKRKQVDINKAAITTIAQWAEVTEDDREILRSFFRLYNYVQMSMDDTITNIRRIIELKAEAEELKQQAWEVV